MTLKSCILTAPPRWHFLSNSRFPQEMPKTESLGSWLKEPGSLTQRLRNRYGKGFQVDVLLQKTGIPLVEEQLALGLERGERALIREVALMANSVPVILARSIIPERTARVADRRLSRLGTQPLGDILFSHPELAREALQWTQVPLKGRSPTSGRRSLYTLGDDSPLLVAEFFLPELFEGAH
jgi:chorismate--pyruvate lyase